MRLKMYENHFLNVYENTYTFGNVIRYNNR
jgi:hypothetical protein